MAKSPLWSRKKLESGGGDERRASAAASRPNALIEPSSKLPLRIAKPAGLGALAITVRPPPVTAPATSEYLNSSETPSTSEPR